MNLVHFLEKSSFASKTELDKVLLLMFYYCKIENRVSLSIEEICEALINLGYTRPNTSRLKVNITKSKKFIKSNKINTYQIHPKEIAILEKEFPFLSIKSEEIITDDTILPEVLYKGTRGFIEILAKQLNASYHHNLFDGCAVLMRRLLEILIILSYTHKGKLSEIQDAGGNTKNLNTIINYTISNKVINISKDVEEVLDDFRQLGNFSAHKIQYNTRRSDIERIRLVYRLAIEELLYESGLKK